MLSVSSRIWTHVTVSISYDDNHYTTGTSRYTCYKLAYNKILQNLSHLGINSKVKLTTIVEGNPKAPFLIATTPRCRGGCYSFPGLLYFTLDPYLIMLSVKQGGIKNHFLSLWYDATWDWTQVSRALFFFSDCNF